MTSGVEDIDITNSSPSIETPRINDKSVRLFSFGSNSLGQLSIGHVQDAHTPTEVLLPYIPSDISIITGGNHTFILSTAQKLLYSVGDNTFGQCTVPHESNTAAITASFVAVPPPTPTSHWISISAGWQFSILLSSDNRLYACGNGPRGELGLGESITTSTTPTEIPSFPPPATTVVQLASGVEHTLALLSDGRIYGWGNGRKGQLGTLSAGEKYLWSPHELRLDMPDDFQVASMVAGREFSAFTSRTGEVQVFGNDKWGVIKLNPMVESPMTDWRVFSAGWGALYVLREDGKVVSWGRNTHGQLPPDDMPPLDKLAVGSEHALAVGRDGKLYAWGWGEHGNCGKLEKERGEVVKWVHEVGIDGLVGGKYRVEGIAAGCATSWVWVSEVD
ncbi:hypothetical protein TWF696_004976 [Orbilia brochopaga]|uniref:RCC1-like domain-containing protein n=1 Tax=Orbilia brochopaga TaxID=3140254 RepID=A0AAV9UZF4_9PEZI